MGKWVIIGCSRSAGAALDALRASGWPLPEGVEWVELPCGSAIDSLHLLKAFEAGAQRVLVLSCYDGACRSVEGSAWAAKRVQAVRQLLADLGMDPERLTHRFLSPTMAADLRGWIELLVQPEPASGQVGSEA